MSHRSLASPPPDVTAEDLLLSPLSVGKCMGRKDPHYKPSQGSLNPFTALSQFRGAKKLLGGTKETGGWHQGESFSSCFELPSPFFSALCAEERKSRPSQQAMSLPSSPTALRRAASPRQATPTPSPPRKTSPSLFSHPLFALRTKTPPQLTSKAGGKPLLQLPFPGQNSYFLGATVHPHPLLYQQRACTSTTNLADESSSETVGYPLLRRRGSCESGFFSVGDGERTSTSDLSPDCQASFDESVAAALGCLSSSGGLLGAASSNGELQDLLDEYSSLGFGSSGSSRSHFSSAKRSSSIYTDSSEDISSLGGGDYSWDEGLRPAGALSNPHHITRIVDYFERKQRLSAEDPKKESLATAWLARQHRELLFQAAARKYPGPSTLTADAFEALSHRLAQASTRSPKIAQIQKSLVSVPVEKPVVRKTSIPQRLSICEGTVRSKLQLFDKK